MKAVLCVLAVAISMVSGGLVAGPAAIVRTPQFDSAIIKSDRLGGNFAYSTAEAHAYAAVSPIVQNVVSPVAVSYSAHPVAVHAAPAVAAYHAAPAVAAYHAAPAVAAYHAAPAVAAYHAAPLGHLIH